MFVSEIQYAKSGDVTIAYEIRGDGQFDLVFVPGWWSHLEVARASDEAACAEAHRSGRIIHLDDERQQKWNWRTFRLTRRLQSSVRD